ncbi:hypothetical protein BKA65DRAFT_490533, partial [Rhexocercosporidium sp. MPI-PUGE-AT-0058]
MESQLDQIPELSTPQPSLKPAAYSNAVVAEPVPNVPEHIHILPAAPRLDRFHEYTEVTFGLGIVPFGVFALNIEETQLRGCARIDDSLPRRSWVRTRILGFKIWQYELPIWDTPHVDVEETHTETLETRDDDRVESVLGDYDIRLSASLNDSHRSRTSVDLESLAEAGISAAGSANGHVEASVDQVRTGYRLSRGRRQKHHYVVVGVFSRVTSVPTERLLEISKPSRLFRSIWWASVAIRGNGMLFSLRDIKGFNIYQCHPKTPLHRRIKVDPSSERALLEFYHAYSSWDCPREVQLEWASWLAQLNKNNTNPLEGDMLSLEIILGWSIPRITIVVLTPVLLSLGIGLWLNSKNWGDATTIQTAWSVASYIATAGAC